MLTQIQRDTLQASMLANSAISSLVAADNISAIVEYYNSPSTHIVWNENVPIRLIDDAIIWANLTPTDAPDGTVLYSNRALSAQSKQITLQILLQGKDYADCTKTLFRNGIQDALSNLPTGVGGAIVGGGWVAVKLAMRRPATNFEKVFCVGPGNETTPATISGIDVPGQLDQTSLSMIFWTDNGIRRF